VPLGVGGEDATAILWSPKVGAIVFGPGADEAQQARRRVVEFARRNANGMAPNDPSELATSLTVEKNVLVLWRDDRPRARQAVLGCLR